MAEMWRGFPRYPDYEVSDLGRVRRADSGRLRKLTYVDRYAAVLLWNSDESKRCYLRVHVAVLEAFVGPRPKGMLALHRDDDPRNPVLTNLYWGTRADNQRDAARNGLWKPATHCRRGDHLYTSENTYLRSDGYRECVRCRQEKKSAAVLAVLLRLRESDGDDG